MTNVIEFPKPPESQPESHLVTVVAEDGKAVKWFKFTCSYEADGKKFLFSIWAKDFAHAETLMAGLRATARVDGQLFAEIPL